jgi:ribbon-helix-helix CopG family protein
MRTAKTVCITLPPDLLKKAQKVAAREHRTMSELFREALRHYMGLASATERSPEPDAANEREPQEQGPSVVHSFRMDKPQNR